MPSCFPPCEDGKRFVMKFDMLGSVVCLLRLWVPDVGEL